MEVQEYEYNPITLFGKAYIPIPYISGVELLINKEPVQVFFFNGRYFELVINMEELLKLPKVPCLFIPNWDLSKYNNFVEKQSIPKIYNVVIYNKQYFFTETHNRIYQSKNPEYV